MDKRLKEYIDTMPPFGKGMEEIRGMCVELIKQIDKEQKHIRWHIEKKEGGEEALGHLYNALGICDRMMYLIVWLFHYDLHSHESHDSLMKLEKDHQKLHKEFERHQPKLRFIDQKVNEVLEREKRGEEVSGYG